MPADHQFTALTIGWSALETLKKEKSAVNCGSTSKGLFTLTDDKRIIFISNLPHRGPLTINIKRNISMPDKTRLNLSWDKISAPEASLEITIGDQTAVWIPQELKIEDFDLEGFLNCYKQIKKEWLMLQKNCPDPSTCFNRFMQEASSKNISTVIGTLAGLLGCGSGLTPSGDDFICGFLLAANAWHMHLSPNILIRDKVNEIINLAQTKTTALSANLIACAAIGSADERIMRCIQWLHCGGGTLVEIKKELQSYGSSSGLDTLAGMLTFIQSSLPD